MTKEIIFGIATLIGTAIGIWQAIKLKKQEKDLEIYKYLFDVAEKKYWKRESAEELEILKNEKQKMDEAIKTELPRRAHMTVLSDRLREDEKNVVTYYKRFMDTRREYENLEKSVTTDVPEGILNEIEHQIMPQYLLKEKKDNYLKYMTLLACASSLV